MSCLSEIFASREYPGRMIIIGADPSGANSVVTYAITGRSPSSQARRLIKEGDSVLVKPTDEALLQKGNPELLIYPAISFSGGIAVSNGKQTADIRKELKTGKPPEKILFKALENWSYEPDDPIFTPRISGCVLPGRKGAISILRRAEDGSPERFYFAFPLVPGKGKMISTYSGPVSYPLSSFQGEPVDTHIEGVSARDMGEAVYEALGPKTGGQDFRVAVACVYAKYSTLSPHEIHIVNRIERKG